ncbi:MAG TPA: Xaa-Pro peptidase family protein [Acidobacteriaceae bacterium]|nr:Xaa-Pro peptidase family protein [Acidobacteriaceae bacterium]
MAIDPQRRAAVVRALHGSDLVALACFTPAEVLLLTGYCPVMGASMAIATRDQGVWAILPEDEQELAKATSNAELIPYRPHLLDKLTNASEALAEPLKQLAKRLRLSTGEIGTKLYSDRQPAPYLSVSHSHTSFLDVLRRACPEMRVVSADHILDQLKSRKTATEVARLQHACALTAPVFRIAGQAIAIGRREDEVAGDLAAAFTGAANDGFERGFGSFFCMSGPNSVKAAGAYARTRRRVIESGDLVMIHANTAGDGFWTDITRTFIAGEPSKQQQRMQEAIAEARDAALKAITPDAAASTVDRAARSVLEKHCYGPAFKHATGHGVGFAAADPNALPRIHPASPDVLETGMTFNIEPAIYLDGIGGMRHCDVVVCAGSGPTVLTDFE